MVQRTPQHIVDNFHRECSAIVYTYKAERSRKGYYVALSLRRSFWNLPGSSDSGQRGQEMKSATRRRETGWDGAPTREREAYRREELRLTELRASDRQERKREIDKQRKRKRKRGVNR